MRTHARHGQVRPRNEKVADRRGGAWGLRAALKGAANVQRADDVHRTVAQWCLQQLSGDWVGGVAFTIRTQP